MIRKRYDVTNVESENQSFADHPFVRYINQSKQLVGSDHFLAGAARAKLQTLWGLIGLEKMAETLLQEPGDRGVDYDQDKTAGKGLRPKAPLGKPIAYDVWYLFWAGNILRSGHSDYTPEEWITHSLEKMVDYFHEVDPSDVLRALKQPGQDENMDRIFTYPDSTIYPEKTTRINGFQGMTPGPVSADAIADWKFTIKEAWFETILFNNSPFYPSLPRDKSVPFERYVPTTSPGGTSFQPIPPPPDDAPYTIGPKEPPPDGYAGYIAFPVGAMGVMWQITLATASSLARGDVNGVHAADAETTIQYGKELYPPFDINRKEVAGAKLVDKGYLITDDTTVEYPAQPFPGLENPKRHGWFRYWIKKDNVEIVPGEFAGLVCRAYPNHNWWFQESSPFVYAGNWIETEFYTSGVVKAVLEPDTDYDPDAMDFDVGSKLYRVWVKNEELILASSDFKEYEVDDRVGVIKTWRDGNISGDTFKWTDLKFFNLEGKTTDDTDLFTTDWQIVPVDFYGATG